MERRDFLQYAGAVAAGAAIGVARPAGSAPRAMPLWLHTAIDRGLGLYQWYKLDPDQAPGRPQSFWSHADGTGSAKALKSPLEASDPDNDKRIDPAFGIAWNQHFPPIGGAAKRVHYSGPTLRRAGSVLLLHGGGHSNSWRNDVAEIHLGDDKLLRQVVTPPTPYDKIRFCAGTGAGTKCAARAQI